MRCGIAGAAVARTCCLQVKICVCDIRVARVRLENGNVLVSKNSRFELGILTVREGDDLDSRKDISKRTTRLIGPVNSLSFKSYSLTDSGPWVGDEMKQGNIFH